jgi:TetR/AcrR family transcriptional regulator of autoinduction and epiphytic fitness
MDLTTAPPVDPRIERTRGTVLRAALDLLVEGGAGHLTIDAVVARSGVAKTTIYRHWPSRADLLRATFEAAIPKVAPPAPGMSFEEALAAAVGGLVAICRSPEWQRTFPALIGASLAEPDLAKLEEGAVAQQRAGMHAALQLGIDEGVLPGDTDVAEASLQILGPFMMAMLTGEAEIDDRFGDRMVELFLASRTTVTPSTRLAAGAS